MRYKSVTPETRERCNRETEDIRQRYNEGQPTPLDFVSLFRIEAECPGTFNTQRDFGILDRTPFRLDNHSQNMTECRHAVYRSFVSHNETSQI